MTHKKWNVLKSEYILKTPYINVRYDKCVSLRSNNIDYYVIERADAVGIVAFTEDKKIILERQYRYPIGEWIVEIPAGLIEKNENPKKTAKRELLEETGYEVKNIIKLGCMYPMAGLLTQKFTLYLGFGAKKIRETELDKSEDLELMLLPLDKAVAMIEKGKIYDTETICGILQAKLYIERHTTNPHIQ